MSTTERANVATAGTNYHAWTPDTGTTELPALHKGWPLEDQPTTELAWWHPRPSVPTLVVRPSRRSFVRRLLTGGAA